MIRDGSRSAVPEVPAVSGLAVHVRPPRVFARRRRARPHDAGLRAARRPGRDGRGRRATCSSTAACCSPKRAPAPARRSPTSCRPSSAGQRVLVSTGTKNLQEQIYFKDIPALRDALGVPFTATYMKGRANYLCLHRLDQLQRRRSAPAVARRVPADRSATGSARTETGDRAELEGPAGGSAVLERGVGDRRDLPRRPMPALRRLLRHADAAARRRVRRGHRQPSPAVRRRRGPAERVRRGDSRVQPRDRRRSAPARGRRDAVLRLQRQHLSRRGSRARRRAVRRLGRRRRADGRDEVAKALDRLRDRARTFLHRARLRASRRTVALASEERVRATDRLARRTRAMRRRT